MTFRISRRICGCRPIISSELPLPDMTCHMTMPVRPHFLLSAILIGGILLCWRKFWFEVPLDFILRLFLTTTVYHVFHISLERYSTQVSLYPLKFTSYNPQAPASQAVPHLMPFLTLLTEEILSFRE